MMGLLAGLMLATVDPGISASPAFDYVEKRQTYPVHASTRRELVAALRHARTREIDGSGGSVARTSQDLGMRYELEPVAGGCRFKDLQVSLSVTIHLPEWEPAGRPRESLVESWTRMRDALERHEEGHRDIALDSADYLHKGLLALGVQKDCQSLRREAQRLFFRAQLRHSVRDGAYERRTRHGIAQGAVL
ncbi:hypothetical protein GCM10011521_10190 [Arenimonas soli]|uniref:DUF922 domain-containing protein n=1 Tax=Arenimonas soli TaxID=2269504 RepID=A0ABQ1HEI4_9GAMM|nr:DUF922 domain-containing protein [Arenimonas soli]GGA73975.1 hypothetical protein GCM10011521_10190 [Arenimonas soli]